MAARKSAPKVEGMTLQQQTDLTKVRALSEVVPEIQRLRDEGMTVPQICAELDVTYHVVNQVITQSYKMAMDTVGVFERQERMRLGLEGV